MTRRKNPAGAMKLVWITALLWLMFCFTSHAPAMAAQKETLATKTIHIGVIGMAGGAVQAMKDFEDPLFVEISSLKPAAFAKAPLPDLSSFDLILVSFAPGDHKDNYKKAVTKAKAENPDLKIFGVGPPPIFSAWAEWIGKENIRYDRNMAAYYGLSRKSMGHMLQYVLVTYFARQGEIMAPQAQKLVRIFHPDYGEFETVKDFLARAGQEGWDLDKTPRVALGSWRHHVVFHQPRVIRAIMDELKNLGILSVCLVADDPGFRDRLLSFKPDLVVMTSHTREDAKFWESLGVPRIHALWFTEESIDQWRRSNQPGMGKGRLVHQLVSAELKGATECLTAGGTESGGDSGEEILPIPDRIRRLGARAKAWIDLARKPNSQKKIGLITYDREADKTSLMSGPHHCLNAPESMIGFLERLKQDGYATADLPLDEQQLLDRLIDHGRQMGTWEPGELDRLARSGKPALIPEEQYRAWFEEKIPLWRRQEVITHFGPPPGNLMVWEYSGKKYLVIPKLDMGSLVLLTQPPKGETLTATADQDMVDNLLPPTHHYLATYFWLQEEFGADAVVHFGSHGSEWLFPGKQAFLSKSDWSDILLGNLPNINPWLSSNIAEHTPCRRRAMAVTPSFMPPPLMEAGLSDDLLNLESAITKYLSLGEGALKAKFAKAITDQVRSCDLDISWLAASGKRERSVRIEKFQSMLGLTLNDEEINRISVYLHDLKNEHVPAGMHTLGKGHEDRLLMPYLVLCMGKRFLDGLQPLFPETGTAKDRDQILKAKALEILDLTINKGFSPAEAVLACGAGLGDKALPAALGEGLGMAKAIYQGMTNPRLEMDNIIAALKGRFIPPGPSGSPERNPGVIPTGRNMVVLNPEELPSKSSWELGTRLMKEHLEREFELKKKYPEKIAFSLVPYTTFSDYGIVESQILYLMGVRPVWDAKNRVRDLELIPLEELGRPRIDVFLSARSIYRDELPSMMKLLDKAIQMAASFKEDGNRVYRHSRAIQEKLEQEGMPSQKALALSRARMFGTDKDEIQDSHNWFFYLADRTGEWDTRKDLLNVYLKTCKHVYTKDYWGENAPEAFDAAIHGTETIIRSWYDNRDFTLGNKFAWWVDGILSLTIKEMTGKEPDYLFMDVRDPSNAGIVTARDAVKKDLNARLLNPRWIREVMKEGYAGGTLLAKDAGNLMGWEITREHTLTDADWNRFADVYVRDKHKLGLRGFFDAHNPHAFQEITVTLLESIRKGYWQANGKTREEILMAYAESVARHGSAGGIRAGGNQKLERFVTQALSAPGKPEFKPLLAEFQKKVAEMKLPQKPDGKEAVQGKKMSHTQQTVEKKTSIEKSSHLLYAVGVSVLILLAAGFLAKSRRTI